MKKYIFSLVIFVLTLYIYVNYIQKRSLSSFLIEKYFYITNAKKYFEYRSEDKLKKLLDEAMKNTDKRYVPTKISYEIEDKDLHNMQVLVWNDKKDKNQKVIFYFVSDNRIDFRELVKEVNKTFNRRVEFYQIKFNDEGRILNAFGKYGREIYW